MQFLLCIDFIFTKALGEYFQINESNEIKSSSNLILKKTKQTFIQLNYLQHENSYIERQK